MGDTEKEESKEGTEEEPCTITLQRRERVKVNGRHQVGWKSGNQKGKEVELCRKLLIMVRVLRKKRNGRVEDKEGRRARQGRKSLRI